MKDDKKDAASTTLATAAIATVAPATAPRKGRHAFVVNAGRDMLEFEVDADEFEVSSDGVYFTSDEGKPTEHVSAFVSHPCIVRLDDDGAAAAAREPGK